MDISFTWEGRSLTVRPSFDLYMQIEEKASLARVADFLSKAAGSLEGRLDLPMTQVSYVMWCVLRAAGETADPMDVHHQCFKAGNEYGKVLVGLITNYYGQGPEAEAKSGNAKAGKSRRST